MSDSIRLAQEAQKLFAALVKLWDSHHLLLQQAASWSDQDKIQNYYKITRTWEAAKKKIEAFSALSEEAKQM